jgi:hypothetical protein
MQYIYRKQYSIKGLTSNIFCGIFAGIFME